MTFDSNISIVKDEKGKNTFKFETMQHFGGILIRGLYKLTDGNYYVFGPQKCVSELWDKFNALAPAADEYPTIIRASRKDNLNSHNLRCCKRCINIKDEDRKQKIKEWIIRLGLGGTVTDDKEEIYKVEMFDNEKTQLYRYFNVPLSCDPCSFIQIPSSSRPKKVGP